MARGLTIGRGEGRLWILVAMGGALGIVLLEEALVGISLPAIRDELGLSQVATQWVVNAYVLTLTALVAAGGRLGDLLGHRRVFMGGAAILAIASVGAGLAETGGSLLTSRVVQGIGAAILVSLSPAMVGIAFVERERGTALGVYSVVAAASAAAAPLLGGILVDLASWRWIFLINVPLVAIVMAIVATTWRHGQVRGERASFDPIGLGLLFAFVVPLVLALMQVPEWGWGSPITLVLFLVSALGLVAFVDFERRIAVPLIDVALLRPPPVIGANLVIFCAQFSKMAVIVFGALYLQDQLDVSAIGAGAALLAALVPPAFTALWAGVFTDRMGARRPTLFGTGLMAVSLAWLAALVGEGSYLALLPGFVLWGIALPFLFSPAYATILSAVGPGQRGEASGITSTGRQLGGALAIAVLGTLLVSVDSFSAVFAVTAALTTAVWIAAFLLID